MKSNVVRSLDRKRYEVLCGLTRSPLADSIGEEIAWFSNANETLIGVLLRDFSDDDYTAIVLAMDEGKRFCAITLEHSIQSVKEACEWLFRAIERYTGLGSYVCKQGNNKSGPDLFTPIVHREKLHPGFMLLKDSIEFLAAREVITRIMPYYFDMDGNFVEQFQSTGFDARIWELYLFMSLNEEKFILDRTQRAPDIMAIKDDTIVAIEAVTVGHREDGSSESNISIPAPGSRQEIEEKLRNLFPIRFGSALYSKLCKKYWEKPHVKGNPLVFAIADFQDTQSMLWTSSALPKYLYGYEHEFCYDEKGTLIIKPLKIESHMVGEKEIPSGFFYQPDTENISAVLFSNCGTISKFNRIGRQAGFFDPRMIMLRYGTCFNRDPYASSPKIFNYEVNELCNETWAEGLSMFHNPNAKYPIPEEFFPNIGHHHICDGQIVSKLPMFFPFASITLNIKVKDRNA